MIIKKALTFSDVLLVPKYSEVMSRSSVGTDVKINNYNFNHPLVVSNMSDLVGEKMLTKTVDFNGLTYMHRFVSFEEQLGLLKSVRLKAGYHTYNFVGASIGVQKQDYLNLKDLYDEGIRHIVIDIAHGDSKMCVDMIKYIKNNYKDILLCAGNVCTYSGAERLFIAGADIVKVNVGAGSICSTRLMTGNGVSQLTALMDAHSAKKYYERYLNRKLFIMADGGCANPGDVVKSLCFADLVMTGNLFAGSVDTPGDVIVVNGVEEKAYNGSSTHKTKHVEGFKGAVNIKPEYEEIVKNIMQGVKSGCSYQGVDHISKLQNNPEFVEITHAGMVESGAHNIRV